VARRQGGRRRGRTARYVCVDAGRLCHILAAPAGASSATVPEGEEREREGRKRERGAKRDGRKGDHVQVASHTCESRGDC
jgi:hypothetical protein